MRELRWRSAFEYTLEGQLIGHISIAQRMLSEQISGLNAEIRTEQGSGAEVFPEALRLLLEHMLLTHHGKLEFGSPKLPMTPEALLLSALDDLEAKFQTLRGEFAAAAAAGRGAEQPTEWVRSMERTLFDSGRYLDKESGEGSGEKSGQELAEETVPLQAAVPAAEPVGIAEAMPSFSLRLPD